MSFFFLILWAPDTRGVHIYEDKTVTILFLCICASVANFGPLLYSLGVILFSVPDRYLLILV